MSNFAAPTLFCEKICADLSQSATVLPLNAADAMALMAELAPDKFTYMVLSDGFNTETIKVNSDLTIVRGSPAMAWQCGAELFFTWGITAMDAYHECKANPTEGEQPDIKIPGFTPVWDPDLQQWCFEQDEGTGDTGSTDPFEWEWCGYRYTYRNGVITREAIPLVPDAEYNPAKVVMQNGKPTFSKGCPVIHNSSCGGCGNCADCDAKDA